ncbi:MAG TPA: sugar phosphate isomerase/epimerase family protein [Blastocatellia bacterium]|nr:sugar phosphate isomerase/epimerase family protein [Blastocatellia bacterium]
MKLAISNIAWDHSEEDAVADLLVAHGVRGVEIAPTKIWPAPDQVPDDSAREYRQYWASRNIEIVAFQSLLFGRPELEIFKTDEARRRTFDYLSQLVRLAAGLGAGVLVFGSPRNRVVGDLNPAEAMDIALDFFHSVGEVAARHGLCFCIEPNPAAYGCDFIRTAAEGCDLVRRVNHPAFRLHLDTGVMTMNGESYERAIEDSFEWMAHLHISEPQLGVTGSGTSGHDRVARQLRQLGYDRWISIEMRNGWTTPNTIAVQTSLDYVHKHYFGQVSHA